MKTTSKLLFLFMFSNTILFANPPEKEQKLKEAIALSNKGKYEDALSILKFLAGENSNDERLFLSMGFIYQTIGNTNDALSSFEKAVQIKPSENGYYSLGLLYEAKAIQELNNKNSLQTLKKALASWNDFVNLNSKDTKKVEVATRHIKNIKEQIQQLFQE